MRVAVLGGAGFIGSHLVEVLCEKGHEVVVFDRKEYLFPKTLGVIVKIGDIANYDEVEDVIKGCDVIYNYAGIADIEECIKKPIETIKYNILGNMNALEASRKNRIKRFIYASSIYIYSDTGSIYKTSKLASELLVHDYWNLHNLPYTIVRYGSLYGERAPKWNSINLIIKEALKSGTITYHGSGDEVREYIHAKDAADLSANILNSEFKNQEIILTGNQTIKYKDLLEMINEILGGNIKIIYKKKESNIHYKVTPYSFNSKIGRKLTQNPFIDMGQGILSCVEKNYKELNKCKNDELGKIINRNRPE